MKTIEDIIRRERETIDFYEPSSGHDKRFRKKIENRKIVVFLIRGTAIAAGLLILAGLWFLWNPTGSSMGNHGNGPSLASLRPEYKEVELYYTTCLKEKTQEINSISCIPEWRKKALFQEIKELTENDTQLLAELKKNPGNDLLVETILYQYKTKLDLLDELLMRLEPICGNINNTGHEKNKSIL